MPAERDARGRFTSSNREDSESVEENRELEQTENSIDSESVEENREPEENDSVNENQEPDQSDSVNENRESEQTESNHDDAAEQILFEMAGQTARTTNHPVEDPEETKPVKLLDFKTAILTRENVRTWRSDVEEFCQIQGVWKAVEKTLELQDKPEELARLLANQKWASLDATAKYYIKQNLKQEDKTTVRDFKNSGAVWKYLMGRYERTTQYDIVIALRKAIQWKKDPKMGIEDSLQQLEQLNAELYEISDKKNRFNELMILTIFLEGLPMEFDSIRDALFGSANLERGLVLSRLHQKELKSTVNAASETAGESVSRAEQRKCFNCRKPGHFARNCKSPRKEKDRESDQQEERKKEHGKKRVQKKTRFRKDKVRVADEDSGSSDSDSDGSGKEAVYRLNERISDRFESLIQKEKTLRAKGRGDPVIDSGATSPCSPEIDLFESLDERYCGILGTAGKSTLIAGKGVIRFPLSGGGSVRLTDVLYVPSLSETLLSTQTLYADRIWNEHIDKGYRFFRKRGETLAKGYNIGRTSYLGWVRHEDALATEPSHDTNEVARLVKATDWQRLHRRLGHPGNNRLKLIVKQSGLDWNRKECSEALQHCETCIQAKSVKNQNHKPAHRASRPLKRVYMDFWGPYTQTSNQEGWKYYLSLTDDHTRFSWVYLTKNREMTTVRGILERWLASVEREKGVQLLCIRTDNAKEFTALIPWAEEKGIRIEFIEPHTPSQNGVAERLNRLLLEIMRAILIDADVPKNYWPYALKIAVYLKNRTIQVQGTKKSPFELWFGHAPDLSKLRVPFCKTWFHIETKDKLEPRAIEGVFMEYDSSRNHYLVMALKDRKIHRVTNPIFLENKRGFISNEPGERETEAENPQIANIEIDQQEPDAIESKHEVRSEVHDETRNEAHDIDAHDIDAHDIDETDDRHDIEEILETSQIEQSESESSNQIDNNDNESNKLNLAPQPVRQSTRIRKPTQAAIESQDTENLLARKPRAQRRREAREEARAEAISLRAAEREKRQLRDAANMAIVLDLYLSDEDEFAHRSVKYDDQIPIPKTYDEAIRDPVYGTKWREAVRLELANLIQFGTWEYVRRPKDHKVVSTKWVFLVKYDADGRIDRFKARLVARGFSQQEGLDFEDTFAPVIRLESLRIIFAIAASFRLTAHLLDAVNAYVGSQIDKEIYMEIPQGVDPQTHGPKDVCRILQSLYGLKQSAYLWNQKVKQFVESIGFRQSTADPGVFINDRGVIIALYVDDILVFSKNIEDLNKTKAKLKEFHPMKDSKLVNKILGIRITWTKNSIRLDQETYAKSILEEFGMLDSKPTSVPLSPSIDLSNESSKRLRRDLHSELRHILGRLTYLAGGTRPDIQFPVNRQSQHLSEPREVHLSAAKHLLRYIKGTITYGITYTFGAKGSVIGYSDSSYGNATKHRSTSAYVFMMAGGPVSWSSRKQPITAMSTTEAEYVAAAEAAKHAIWIRHFLYSIGKRCKESLDIRFDESIPLGIDNQGAIALASNPVNHLRSKHIKVRYHAIRDFIENGEIKATYVPTEEMLADGLTKAVKPEILSHLVKSMRLEA